MVSLRSAASPPSSVRSSSRTNTPEPDIPSHRNPTRTYQSANSRRKSSRLSQTSPQGADYPEKPPGSDQKPYRDESAYPEGFNGLQEPAHEANTTRQDEETEPSMTVAQEDARGQPSAVSPLLREADALSAHHDQVQRSADALALLEAEKYMATTSKRRRSTRPVRDYATDEEEEEEEDEEEEQEQQEQEEEQEEAQTEENQDDEAILRRGRNEEAVHRDSSDGTEEATVSPQKISLSISTDNDPLSGGQAQPSKPSAKPPSSGSAFMQAPSAPMEQPDLHESPAKLGRPPISSDSSKPFEANSSRKRKTSPVIQKPAKRQKAANESQRKKSIVTEAPIETYSFEVIVFGDANASVQVQIPARNRIAAPLVKPEYNTIYPFNIVRWTSSNPLKPKSTFTAYRFPLPNRHRHESFDKVRIKIYGKTVKAPSARDGFRLEEVENGRELWKLEADEDRCRWIQA